MESITKFLDPKSIPDVTGDDLDIEKALNKTEDDSDTIEVNITSKEKGSDQKIKDVVLPGTTADDSVEVQKTETSISTDTTSDSENEESSEESVEDKEETKETSKEETTEEPKETTAEEPKEEKKEEPKEEPKEEKKEEPKEEEKAEESEQIESAEKMEEDLEPEEPEVNDEKTDAVDAAVETSDEKQEETNGQVDHGESDLEVDTQQTPPLLKLISEYDYYSTKVYETPNGAKLIYINKPSEICYCSFDFKVGSFYEDDSNRGISHLLEHLMFNGCPGMSSLEFNEKMDRLGMSVNAFTSRMVTSYYFSGLKANFIPAFDLYANVVNSFTPTEEIIEKEKGVVINEIGVQNDNNWTVLSEAILAQAYRQHPVSHPILGYDNVIRNISLNQVKEWYETNYNAKNLTVYLVGEFVEEDLMYVASKMQLVRDGQFNPNPVITDTMVIPNYKNVITHKEGAIQTLIDSSLVIKNEAFNIYEVWILSNVLGGTMSSYLWNEFREKRSIAYLVGAKTSCLDPLHLTLHLYAGLNNAEDAETAKSLFNDAFKYARAITEDDFNKGLNIELASMLENTESGGSLLDIVRDSLYFDIDLDDYISTFKNLTYDSYQSFATQIDPDKMVTGILYPMEY